MNRSATLETLLGALPPDISVYDVSPKPIGFVGVLDRLSVAVFAINDLASEQIGFVGVACGPAVAIFAFYYLVA